MSARGSTRITDSPEFDRVYRDGKAYRGRLFVVHAFPNELATPRLGLSVSKKVGNAVVRNKVRRRLKEIFHESLTDIPRSLDLVVSARPRCSEASFDDLKSEFSTAIKRLSKAA